MDVRAGVDKQALEGDEPEFKPLTAKQAQEWRRRQRSTSVVTPLLWQVGVGLLCVLGCWLFASRSVAWSALYGVASVLVPAVVVVRALRRQQLRAVSAMAALASLVFWEGVKVVLTIALLLAAPSAIENLNWLALLLGFVVTVKAAWFGWWWQLRSPRPAVRDN